MIERASADDVMALVSDQADPPMQVGAALLLEVGDEFDAPRLAEALQRRVTSVPRLRQRLIDVPVGCGRPVWSTTPALSSASILASFIIPGRSLTTSSSTLRQSG